MHELSIATEILRVCRAEVERHGGGRLESVRVEVGELTAVEPDLLRFAWAGLLADSTDADADLQVDCMSARQICAECGDVAVRQPGSWLRLCPHCEGALALEGGTQLDVRDITFQPLPITEAVLR